MRTQSLILFLLLIPGVAFGYDFGNGVIHIPGGFEGPVTQDMGAGTSSIAFSHSHDSGGAALLQIMRYDPNQEFPAVSEEERKMFTQQYLLQFLGSIERRREDFTRDHVEFINISGQPAAKVNWEGKALGKPMHGIMYCVIYDSKIFSFHTQDFSEFNGRYTNEAAMTIENIKLKEQGSY